MIDLRSDTVTVPTEKMRQAMAAAEVGDDVYGEDPTVTRLEALAAHKLGKEAGLFVPTGTMGNEVAVLTHAQRGDEVIVDIDSHIFDAEVAGLAVLAGVQARALKSHKGLLDVDEIAAAVRPANVHYPRTGLVCIENPHNAAGGTVVTPEQVTRIADTVHSFDIPLHMDGARIFNAAVALGCDASELARPADSVMFCLSKSLCAPVGSMLVGSADWIERARKNRKMLGGGMRQAGVIAAAGIVALEEMVERLAEDHDNARLLAENLAQIPGLSIDLETVQTNMVFVDIEIPAISAPELANLLASQNVLINAVGPRRVRFVTHNGISRTDILKTIHAVGAATGSEAGYLST